MRSRTALAISVTVAVVVIAAVAVAASVLATGKPGRAHPSPHGALPGITVVPTPVTTVAPRRAPAMPARGAYVGAYVQPADYSQPGRVAALHAFQRQLGRRLDIVHIYVPWQAPFPTPSERAAVRQGSMLLISWAGTDTRAITAGTYDSLIRQRAHAIKALHRPVFLEWRWEMNRPALRGQIHSASGYIKAWDHIRAVFARQHVTNVAWVWCPSSKGFGDGTGYAPPPEFYPGDREVDWLCADTYPRAGPYRSFAQTVQPFLRWASHIGKPVMIGEFGVPRSYSPRLRAQWLQAAGQTVLADPQIKALVYFDGDPPAALPDGQYGLSSGSPALAAFRGIAARAYFNPRHLRIRERAG